MPVGRVGFCNPFVEESGSIGPEKTDETPDNTPDNLLDYDEGAVLLGITEVSNHGFHGR
jgi:hypothetical protein